MGTEYFKKQSTIQSHGQIIDLTAPCVMGILNLTPDSFYANSRLNNQSLLPQAEKMLQDGASFLDIGAYSSRPGAQHITEEEEWNRLEPALNAIRKAFPDALLSIDTFRSEIARRAIEHFQVNLINDISAGNMDAKMFETVSRYPVPYILMHMQGTPQSMQENPEYTYLLKEIFSYFAEKIAQAKQAGIKDIILDPGFGFGKTVDHNFELMHRLDEFKIFENPLLIGISRKSMIYKYLDSSPEKALNGTTVLNTLALTQGAKILRVHDVAEAVETVKLFQKVAQSNS